MSFFDAILGIAQTLVQLMVIIIIVNAVLSWLVAFDVVNYRNRLVGSIMQFTEALTAPLLAPLRAIIPSLGGVDITPIILILILQYLVSGWLIPQLGQLLP